MENYNVEGVHLMGDNLKSLVKYCGQGVRFYPLFKMIHPQNGEFDDYCQKNNLNIRRNSFNTYL